MLEHETRLDDSVTACIAEDERVSGLAYDIVDGEIDMDLAYMLPTDKMAYEEVCAAVCDDLGVTQTQVEQALELAKERWQEMLYE